MNRPKTAPHPAYVILIPFILMALLSACSPAKEEPGYRIGQEFTLTIGQSATLSGENLTIRFDSILEDSRCPKNVVCVWVGRVRFGITISESGISQPLELSTETNAVDGYAQGAFQKYRLAYRIEPYPAEAGKVIAPGDYRLFMKISL